MSAVNRLEARCMDIYPNQPPTNPPFNMQQKSIQPISKHSLNYSQASPFTEYGTY